MRQGTNRRDFLRGVGVLGSAGSVAILAGCTGQTSQSNQSSGGNQSQSSSQEQSLIMGSVYSSGHPINEMAKKWAETVNNETDGTVSITIEAGAGGESDVIEQTSIGAIDGSMIGAYWVSQYAPKRFWVESPFVFNNWEQQRRAYMSEYLDQGRKTMEQKASQQIVGQPIYRGYRNTSGNKAFKSPSSIEGINIRVPELDAWVDIWEGFGARPSTVSFDELYSALQQGVVDAQENPAEAMIAKSLYEVQEYYTLTNHLVSTGWFTMNNNTLSGLSESNREIVTNTLNNQIEQLNNTIKEEESSTLEELEDNGMKVVEANKDEWLNVAEPVLKNQFQRANWQPSLQEVRSI